MTNTNIKMNMESLPEIFQFIKDNQLPISKDIEKPWFKRVWLPLTMRQIPDRNCDGWCTQLDTPMISITSDVLCFLGYEGIVRNQQQKFVELLERTEIPFKQITYKDPEADEHVKKDGLQLTEYNRQKKKWVVLDIDDFKDAIMQLNTKRAKEIRLYYRNLESAVFQYTIHTSKLHEEKLNEAMQTLTIKDKQLEDEKQKMIEKDKKIETQSRQIISLDSYVKSAKQREKDGYIYIGGTHQYSLQNHFKIGSAENVKARFQSYQTNRVDEDKFVPYWVIHVTCHKKVESVIKYLLVDFLQNKKKEIYRLHYDDAVKLISYIIDNFEESVEELNRWIRDEMVKSYEKEPFVPDEFVLETTTIVTKDTLTGDTSVIDVTKMSPEEVIQLLKDRLDTFKDQETVTRMSLLEPFKQKKKLLEILKKHFGWTNSKTKLKDYDPYVTY